MDDTLLKIQGKAGELGKWRDTLAIALKTLHAEQQAVKDEHYPELKKLVRRIVKLQDELKELIKDNAGKFDKPRTQIVDGVKFGLQKQKGRLGWGDDAALCVAIRRLADAGVIEQALLPQLINVVEKPVAAGLERLDAKLLKKLGVEVTSDVDAVVIKSVDGGVEKALNAILKDAEIVTLDDEVDAT